jgi:hypothetical protein
MANSYGEILTARGGSYILNTTDPFQSELVYSIVTLENTVFDTLECTNRNGVVTNVLNDHIANAGAAVKTGAMITPMNVEAPFSKIQLASGSVMLVLK